MRIIGGKDGVNPKDYIAFEDRNAAPQTTFGSPANRVNGSVALRPWVTPGLLLSGDPRLPNATGISRCCTGC